MLLSAGLVLSSRCYIYNYTSTSEHTCHKLAMVKLAKSNAGNCHTGRHVNCNTRNLRTPVVPHTCTQYQPATATNTTLTPRTLMHSRTSRNTTNTTVAIPNYQDTNSRSLLMSLQLQSLRFPINRVNSLSSFLSSSVFSSSSSSVFSSDLHVRLSSFLSAFVFSSSSSSFKKSLLSRRPKSTTNS